jgi:Calcineurin-like phosphoesterase
MGVQGSSRDTKHAAGWRGSVRYPLHTVWEEMLRRRKRTRWGNFTWISPGPLLASINDQVVKGLDDLVNERRPRWVASVRNGDWSDDVLSVDHDLGDFSFVLLGDTGEQDASQYAVVTPLKHKGEGTSFAILASDVIYPSGDINDYLDGFYLPYREYTQPIYAIPGNHDWYDGLNGFMFHFCGAEPLADVKYRSGSYTWKERFARALWRNPSPPKLAQLNHERTMRAGGKQTDRWEPPQPGPYYTIDTQHLRIVCIDTGITGVLDRQQGEWLRRVSCDPRDKVLVTGKPIYVDGAYHPGEIAWGPSWDADVNREVGELRTIDDMVRHPDHRYVAAIGGDVHNFQHYPIDVRDDQPDAGSGEPERPPRRIDYVVSGGGGAYLSATHRFGRVSIDPAADPSLPRDVEPLDEQQVRLYPLRGDSLTRFMHRFVPTLATALVIAIAVIAVVLAVFLLPLHGFGEEIGTIGGAKAWQVLAAGLGAIVLAPTAGLLAVKLSNGLAPFGYRTLGATTLFVAVASLIAFALYELVGPDHWGWIWRSALSAAIAVVAPVTLLVGYHLLKDFIPGSVRVGLALLPALALGVAAFAKAADSGPDSVLLTIGAAALVLWLAVIAIGALRHPGDSPGEASKLRLRVGRLLPVAIGFAGVVVLLEGIDGDAVWIPTGVLWMTVALWTLIAALFVALSWRAFLALPWLFRPDADADEVACWLGGKIGCRPTRTGAQDISVSGKTNRLASLTYKSWPFTNIMSELAEATRPPFFKSFLHLDLKDGVLTMKCYGVTGYREDECDPAVEHTIRIPIRPQAAQKSVR